MDKTPWREPYTGPLPTIGTGPTDSAGTRPHEIEAIPNSGGGLTHYCHVCGAIGVSLAPTLPCPGPPPTVASRVVPCTTKTPEPHERGEFPMSCYACHMWADS